MEVLTRLNGKASYFAPKANADRFGRKTFEEAVEIDCYWEDVQVEFVDSEGTRRISQAQVVVDRKLELGGVLVKTLKADLTDTADPRKNTGTKDILQTQSADTLDGTTTNHVVML